MDFKFAISDLVVHRGQKRAAQLAGKEMFSLTKNGIIVGVVVGRVSDECHGGIQRHYHVRFGSQDGGLTAAQNFNEVELEAAPEPRAIDGPC